MKPRRILRIAGIDIFAEPSTLLLVLLIVLYLGPEYAEFISWGGYVLAAATGFLLLGCVLIHELSHALIAKFVYHYHVPSITFFMFGGATRIDDESIGNVKKGIKGEWQFALAGPATNFLLAFAFDAATLIAVDVHVWLGVTFAYLAITNVVLGVFNLLPIFPMDGGRVVRSILSSVTGNFLLSTRIAIWVGRASIIIGMLWAIFALPLFSILWLGFIAFMLWGAASAEERTLKEKDPPDDTDS